MENKNNKGKFIHGFLMGAAGWIISSAVFFLIQFFIERNQSNGQIMLGIGDFLGMTLGIGIVWLPLALISGNISRKKGLKSALWFMAASFFIFAAVVGGCMTMISGLG
ncbi:MAG: hypothetical protein ABRQ27_08990 [Clostridiaceae bacterium]